MKHATMDDLDKIAECHILSFPATLSAKLGMSFVKKQMECFVTDDNKFLLYIDEGNECGGYINGILMDVNTMGSASSMMQSAFNEGLKIMIRKPWLLFDKEVREKLPLIKKNFKYRFFGVKETDSTKKDSGVIKFPSIGLPGMCVHPNHRRKGYASKLMLAAEEYGYNKGLRHLHCTVALTNKAATNCHTKLGYKIVSDNGKSVVMVKEIDY